MGSGEEAQFVFAKYDYTAQGNQVTNYMIQCKAILELGLYLYVGFLMKFENKIISTLNQPEYYFYIL